MLIIKHHKIKTYTGKELVTSGAKDSLVENLKMHKNSNAAQRNNHTKNTALTKQSIDNITFCGCRKKTVFKKTCLVFKYDFETNNSDMVKLFSADGWLVKGEERQRDRSATPKMEKKMG